MTGDLSYVARGGGGEKLEYRMSKSETISKFKSPNVQNVGGCCAAGREKKEFGRQNGEDGGGQKNTRAEEQGTTEDRRGRMDDGGSRKGRGKNFLQSVAEVLNRGICQEAAHILAQRSLFEC